MGQHHIQITVNGASREGNVNFTTKLLAAIRNKFGGHALNKQ